MSRVTVVGAGYVGLTVAVCMAHLGHRVVAVESEPNRLRTLSQGLVPFTEPGLEESLDRAISSSQLRFQAEPRPDDHPDFVFLAVSTPRGSDGAASINDVFEAYRALVEATSPPFVLVIKSTVPVGTGDRLESDLVRCGLQEVDVVSNPEFLREGSAIQDFLHPDRIVIGANKRGAAEAVAGLYGRISAPVIFTSRRSAELSKYAANAMLATRISFINEMASISEALGADIGEVVAVIGADRRIGPAFLSPGLGWGGSCLPKDLAELRHAALRHNRPAALLAAVEQVNTEQAELAATTLMDACSGLPDPTVGVLGLAFKPGTDDLRDSPGLAVIARLVEAGIGVRAHDPGCTSAAALPPGIDLCTDPHAVAHQADAILVATGWPAYVHLDWSRIRRAMRGTLVLDGRNQLQSLDLAELGFDYRAFGHSRHADVFEGIDNPVSAVGTLRVVAEGKS